MIRKLMASTAMLALMTAGSFSIAQAQTQPAQTEPPAVVDEAAAPAQTVAESEETLVPEEPTLASAFMGQSVFSSEDPESDNIGEVNDLIVSDDGSITHAVVGVGGFLGIGEKDVAVPFDELQVVEQDGEIRLVYAATKEQLEAAEEFDRTAYDPGARFAEEQAAMQPDPALDPAAPAGTMAPAPADVAAEPAAGAANQDVAAAPAPAEEQNADAGSADAQQFVEQAAISNQFEIESSQLALDAAENQEIRDFAQRMVDDHSNAGEQLKSTVESAGLELTVPEELDQEHADKLAQLQSATGADFDQQYAQMQVEAHDKAVELFSSYAERGDEEALKEFAANTLPTLQEHKEQIESIDMAAGVATAQTTEGQAPAEDVAAADASQPADATAPAQDMAAADTATNADGETFIGFNADQIRASTMMGQEVYGADDESIGEISDLVLQEDGETRAAIIDVGGFLGVGEKSVAIPFEQIEVQQQEGADPRLVVAMSREELEQAPAFESRTMEDVAATEPDAAADVTTQPEQDVAADPAAQPETEQEVAAEATEPLPEGVIAEDVTAEGEGAGFELATQDLSAEDLIGTAVVGTNEENIGEVGDVIFAQSGEIEAVVIDVGGFLGIGEKPVAVQFDALNVQKDTNGGVQLMINASQEQLEGAPSYEAEQAAVQ